MDKTKNKYMSKRKESYLNVMNRRVIVLSTAPILGEIFLPTKVHFDISCSFRVMYRAVGEGRNDTRANGHTDRRSKRRLLVRPSDTGL